MSKDWPIGSRVKVVNLLGKRKEGYGNCLGKTGTVVALRDVGNRCANGVSLDFLSFLGGDATPVYFYGLELESEDTLVHSVGGYEDFTSDLYIYDTGSMGVRVYIERLEQVAYGAEPDKKTQLSHTLSCKDARKLYNELGKVLDKNERFD